MSKKILPVGVLYYLVHKSNSKNLEIKSLNYRLDDKITRKELDNIESDPLFHDWGNKDIVETIRGDRAKKLKKRKETIERILNER
jgi:hypothetical protein